MTINVVKTVSTQKEIEGTGQVFDIKQGMVTLNGEGKVMSATGQLYGKTSNVYVGSYNYDLKGSTSVNIQGLDNLIAASADIEAYISAIETVETNIL